MAGIYEAMGKTKEAAQTYRQYLKMFPEAPDAPYIKARIADLSSPG
jgi:regulator of sirC expression with transglutaminase-like and TPR domain